MKDHKFKKNARLHYKRDFSKIIRQGKKVESDYLRLYGLVNDLAFSRVGIIIGKKFGHAVLRNKAKRVIRDLFRKFKTHIKHGYDLVFYIKPAFHDLAFVQKKKFFGTF
ncbi:MAG: ribonuclease P protein component [Spirochaetes bacterium]|nr:ribonuclease P protein component [Spirochaetota bacterium]